MQEAQLRPLVAQDKESRVGEFQYFRDVKPPKSRGNLFQICSS